jgi:hypothetical protein
MCLQVAAIVLTPMAAGRSLQQDDGTYIETFRCECFCNGQYLATIAGDCAESTCASNESECEEACSNRNAAYRKSECGAGAAIV